MATNANLNKKPIGWVLQTETLSTVGTVAAPTKTLVATDSGMVFFIDISTVSVVVQLPTPAAGLNFKFVLAVASDNENVKDFLVNTGDSTVDINGNILIDGAHLEITSATSAINMDSNVAPATAGDWFEYTCDGTDWYIQGSVDSASAVALNDAYSGITPA
jgi:hypothetical protein